MVVGFKNGDLTWQKIRQKKSPSKEIQVMGPEKKHHTPRGLSTWRSEEIFGVDEPPVTETWVQKPGSSFRKAAATNC